MNGKQARAALEKLVGMPNRSWSAYGLTVGWGGGFALAARFILVDGWPPREREVGMEEGIEILADWSEGG